MNTRRWPWLVSATLHLIVLVGLGWGVIHWQHRVKQQPEPLPVDPKHLSKQIAKQRDSADQLTDGAKLTELTKAAAKLESISSRSSVEAMGGLLRRSLGARERAYAPAIPAPPGPFDHDSGLIYAARTQSDAQGNAHLVYIMVDKEGRKLEVAMPTGTNLTAADAIERMHQSPTLKALYQQIVLPLLDAEMLKTSNTPSPEDTRSTKTAE